MTAQLNLASAQKTGYTMRHHRIVILGLTVGILAGSHNDAMANFSMVNAPSVLRSASSHTLKNMAFPVVQGFGDHIPLAFALLQIVPKGVMVACNPAIARRTMVTWKGGAPWNVALLRAIAPTGLSASITPVLVKISLDPGPDPIPTK